jgi:hypothetical protein
MSRTADWFKQQFESPTDPAAFTKWLEQYEVLEVSGWLSEDYVPPSPGFTPPERELDALWVPECDEENPYDFPCQVQVWHMRPGESDLNELWAIYQIIDLVGGYPIYRQYKVSIGQVEIAMARWPGVGTQVILHKQGSAWDPLGLDGRNGTITKTSPSDMSYFEVGIEGKGTYTFSRSELEIVTHEGEQA